MLRQQHPKSPVRHIPTPYDGHELGRDDPVWPCYVKEAEKWDLDLVDGWNKGMDILLLFAGLFSAVVTAFLIESYKALQQDSGDVTAAGIDRITDLLQAIAAGEPPSPRNSSGASSDFQPTSAAVAINAAWFLSLSLSILVALAGMLVKQWGESYRSGQGLNPPSVQARIRQSRFDRLIEWRTQDIVLVLPVIMHIALGLFLIGLLVFLWDLNHTVAIPVIVSIAISFTFYGLTSFLPLAVAFCPYNTPISSRAIWVHICRLFWSSARSEDNIPGTQCQQKEKEISENSTPDEVTGRALDWLIKHSEDESIVDTAIRAIAGADLPKDVWDLLAKDSLIVLVAQKFTALFGGVLDSDALVIKDTEGTGAGKDAKESQSSQNSQLLLNFGYNPGRMTLGKQDSTRSTSTHERRKVRAHSLSSMGLSGLSEHYASHLRDGSSAILQSPEYYSTQELPRVPTVLAEEPKTEFAPETYAAASFSGEAPAKQLEVVQSLYGRALTNIAKHHRPLDAALEVKKDPEYGFDSTSLVPLTPDQTRAVTRGLHRLASSKSPNTAAFAITSISAWYMFTMQTRDMWKETLEQALRIILAHVKENSRAQVQSEALKGLMHALPVEVSYWKQDLSKKEKRGVLLHLVELLNRYDRAEQVQDGLPLVLAVLAIAVNDYPDLCTAEDFLQWENAYGEHTGLIEAHHNAAEKWQHGPSDDSRGVPIAHEYANRAGWRTWRAQQAARIYTTYPKLRKENVDSLLLLGFAGLLGSLGTLGLEDKSAEISKAMAQQFHRISSFNKSRSVTLPLVLPLSFDIRAYTVDRIIKALRPSRYQDCSGTLEDDAKINLLKAFVEKPRIWTDFGPQLALPVIEILHMTESYKLRRQCLIAIKEYSLTNPSSQEWEVFASYSTPEKLVHIAKTDPKLVSWTTSIFESFSRYLIESKQAQITRLRILRSLISKDLLETMIVKIMRRSGAEHMAEWEKDLLELPELLKTSDLSNEADRECLEQLKEFCNRPLPTGNVRATRFVLMLRNKVDPSKEENQLEKSMESVDD